MHNAAMQGRARVVRKPSRTGRSNGGTGDRMRPHGCPLDEQPDSDAIGLRKRKRTKRRPHWVSSREIKWTGVAGRSSGRDAPCGASGRLCYRERRATSRYHTTRSALIEHRLNFSQTAGAAPEKGAFYHVPDPNLPTIVPGSSS